MARKFNNSFKNIFLLFVLALVAIVIESSLLSHAFFRSYIPNLLPLLILFMAFYWRESKAMVIVAALGLLADFQVAILLGPSIASFVIVFWIFNQLANRLFLSSVYVIIFSSFFACLIALLVQNLFSQIFININYQGFLLEIILRSFVTALFAVPAFVLFRKMFLVQTKI